MGSRQGMQLRGAAATQITPTSFKQGSEGVNDEGWWQWSLQTLQCDQRCAWCQDQIWHDLPQESRAMSLYVYIFLYKYAKAVADSKARM